MRHAITLLMLFATAVPASAQIFSWRDAQGQLVVSDRPRDDGGEMVTYAVPPSASVRSTVPTEGSCL